MRIHKTSQSAYTPRCSAPKGFAATPVYEHGTAPRVRQYAGSAPESTETLIRARELARIRKCQPELSLSAARAVADARTATPKRGAVSKRSGPCFQRKDLAAAYNALMAYNALLQAEPAALPGAR